MEENNLINTKETNFYELEKIVYNLVCELGRTIIKNILEQQDKQIMQNRNKKEYRHKGYKNNTIKTIMGEIEYKRAIYLNDNKHIYLLDNMINIETFGKFSAFMTENMLKTVVNTSSYRKGAEEIKNLTNGIASHQALQQLVWKVGERIEKKENEEIKLLNEEKLVKGTKEIPALFEEADGLWINLQGIDRKNQIEKYKKKCIKENKEYNPRKSVKTELKLHITYEGWKKDSNRHELINKRIIAGMITPKKLKQLRDARIYQSYNIKSIKLRASNGDGASWINNIMTKDTICQKDSYHIHQEIIRDIQEKEYQEELVKIINEKRYNEVQSYIEHLKYELGGEVKTVEKLETLQKYLKTGLPRYQDILKKQGKTMPKSPDGIEYRDMGTMESQIFSVLKVRLMSGRKAFAKKGANYLSKVCAEYSENKGDIEIEKIESAIPIDNSVEEWIKAIEDNVKKNKKYHIANRNETSENNFAKGTLTIKTPQIQELLRLTEPTGLMYR